VLLLLLLLVALVVLQARQVGLAATLLLLVLPQM
jgi:hypothetical protein